eukprot:TRINITY_DN7745_c0_g1_i1.p1 TRINITY_DN7745_c0_g1~~TRINITY_DN7745_c0_g1_i1.p1  ORF type:complete len:638 (+),score=148.76 TRINITY_DN7745_c0_g1_i1:62-1915(+)
MAPAVVRWRHRSALPAVLVLCVLTTGPSCFASLWPAGPGTGVSRAQASRSAAHPLRAVGPGVEGAGLLLSEASALDGLPGGGFSVAILALLLGGAALLATAGPKERTDGAREEELPPWADMVQVMQDAISGKPFDTVLLNMRARHGDAFRIYVPSLFGEVIVLMGLEANQFVFTEQDKNLDQALGGVVGTAVSGKKTMGTKERKATESGKIFDKASADFFANKKALARATQIFVDSSEDFCDRMTKELKPEENVFESLWTYVVQTNADMLYGNGENAGRIVCNTIDSINKEGLFSSQVRQAGDDLRTVLNERYEDRKQNPEKYKGEDSLFEEFFVLSGGKADDEMLQGLQQFMLTLQLAANGNQLVTIRWLMSHVYGDPAILAGVRAEVEALLAKKGCGIRDLVLDDLLSLNLTNACITEAVRLHSDIPSKLTLRSAEIPMEFGGFKIPQGSTIFLYADAVHKDTTYFPDAASFCPHRYTNPEDFSRMAKDREIVTFGHGRKRCTGELHARSQISALLASFVMRFDMDLVTSEPGNKIPEDHDGPFVFDSANTLKLVNLRPRAKGSAASDVAVAESVAATAALLGQRALPVEPSDETSDNAKCPFSSLFGGGSNSTS